MNKLLPFAFIHAVFFILMLSIFRQFPGVDVLENYFWGRHFELGYYKHPPLFAWVQEGFGLLFGYTITSSYIICYSFIFITFIAVYFLAKEYVSPSKALVAVLLLEALSFAGIAARTFNANLVQIPFWILAPLFYLYGVKTKKALHFALFGMFLGLGFLGKYFTLLLGFVIFLSFISNSQTRRLLKTPLPYIAVFAFLVTISPHLYWLIEHNFQPLNYIKSEQPLEMGFWKARLKYGVSFIGFSIATVLPVICEFLLLYKKFKFKGIDFSKPEESLLFFISVLPFTILAGVSLISGMFVLGKWSATFFFTLPLFVLYFWEMEERMNFKRNLALLLIFFFCVWGAIVVMQGVKDGKDKRQFFADIKDLARTHTAKWERERGRTLKFVSGNTLNAGAFAFYSSAMPDVIPEGNLKFAPYINPEELEREGYIEVLHCDFNLCNVHPENIEEVRKTRFRRAGEFYLVIIYKT